MTVYVDDMNLRADVPNGDHVVRGRWSHLYADTEEELRAFAKQLGLRDSWIQAELDQIEFEEEQFAQGPRGEFPEFEGPGFTEPPLNWCGENHQGWTFTGWALERGYSEEQVEEINREFPPDRAEIEAGARWRLEKAEEEQRYADVYARRTDDTRTWFAEFPQRDIIPIEQREAPDEPPWDNRSAEWYTWHDGVMGQIAQAEEDAGRDLSHTEIAEFWVRAGDREPDDGGGRWAANFEREP